MITKTKPLHKPGAPVMLLNPKLRSNGGLKQPIEFVKRREYGRVIDMAWNAKQGWWDCWVAFFGYSWPTNRQLQKNKPYVLRYLETSLTPYDPENP